MHARKLDASALGRQCYHVLQRNGAIAGNPGLQVVQAREASASGAFVYPAILDRQKLRTLRSARYRPPGAGPCGQSTPVWPYRDIRHEDAGTRRQTVPGGDIESGSGKYTRYAGELRCSREAENKCKVPGGGGSKATIGNDV